MGYKTLELRLHGLVGLGGCGWPSHPETRHRQFPARCAPAALDHPSDAHRLAPLSMSVNGDLMNIRYALPT
jgi:hypothetical protein